MVLFPEPSGWHFTMTLIRAFLIARSEAETFPDEALEEIKQERMLGIEQETDFPPCRLRLFSARRGSFMWFCRPASRLIFPLPATRPLF